MEMDGGNGCTVYLVPLKHTQKSVKMVYFTLQTLKWFFFLTTTTKNFVNSAMVFQKMSGFKEVRGILPLVEIFKMSNQGDRKQRTNVHPKYSNQGNEQINKHP